MIRTTITLAAALALSPIASAGPDTDYPHRDWGKVATLDMSVIDATACIARELNRRGDATVIPADGGNDIDFAMEPLWGPKTEPWLSFKLRDRSGGTELRAFYRHPMSQGKVSNQVEKMQKRCLKVRSITPATE